MAFIVKNGRFLRKNRKGYKKDSKYERKNTGFASIDNKKFFESVWELQQVTKDRELAMTLITLTVCRVKQVLRVTPLPEEES